MMRALRTIDTRDALLLAFLAGFIVAGRAALRWHLHLPGHSMLVTAFALVLARSCVDRALAGTACGGLAGLVCAMLGIGRSGPLLLLQLALPGLVVDLSARILGSSALRRPRSSAALVGAGAGATGFLPVVILEGLAGVDASLIAVHAVAAAGAKALFGALGGAAGGYVARELDHHGLLRRAPAATRLEENT